MIRILPSLEFQHYIFQFSSPLVGPGINKDYEHEYYLLKDVDTNEPLALILVPAGVHTASTVFNNFVEQNGYIPDKVKVVKFEIGGQF